MKNKLSNFNPLKEDQLGSLTGGFSSSIGGVNSTLSAREKNSGQCVTANNCTAGTNCAKSCHIEWPR